MVLAGMKKKGNQRKMNREIKEVLIIEAFAIFNLCLALDASAGNVVELLLETTRAGRNVFLSGMGKCSFIAAKLATTYTSLGVPSFYLNCANALHGDIGVLREKDVVILFSKSGETSEIVDLAKVVREFKAIPIGITCNGDSLLAKKCDVVIVVPIKKEADALNLAPTASSTTFLALGDALGVVTSKHLGFNKRNFNERHGKGELGRISS